MVASSGSWTLQSSVRSSIQSWVSSASWRRQSSFERNSESERALEASLACDATEVPDRIICLPKMATSSRPFGKRIHKRITAEANPLALARRSTDKRMEVDAEILKGDEAEWKCKPLAIILAFQLFRISAFTPQIPLPMTNTSNPWAFSVSELRIARPSKTKAGLSMRS